MLHLEHARQPEGPTLALTLQPNQSISARALIACFVGISLVALIVALYFAFQGLWMPLPFAGLELTAFGTALWWVRRRDRRAERIEINAQRVNVMRRGRGQSRRWEFASGWTRIRLARGAYRWYPRRLLIGSHGKEVEVGAFLNEEERKTAANELSNALDPMTALRR